MVHQFKLNSTETMFDLRMKFHYSRLINDVIVYSVVYDKASGSTQVLSHDQQHTEEFPLPLMQQFIRDIQLYYDKDFRRRVKEEWFNRATDIKAKLNEEYALK